MLHFTDIVPLATPCVSLIFVKNVLGFVTAALLTDILRERLGRVCTLNIAQSTIALGYILVVATAPSPVIVFALFFVGFGMVVNIIMDNTFCDILDNETNTMLAGPHGSYGVGGTIGYLIATALVTQARTVWSRYSFGPSAWGSGKYEYELYDSIWSRLVLCM